MCPIYLHPIRVLHSPVNMVNPISFSLFVTTPLISQMYIALNSKICITEFHQIKHLSSLRKFVWYALCFLVTEVTQKINQYIRQSNPDCPQLSHKTQRLPTVQTSSYQNEAKSYPWDLRLHAFRNVALCEICWQAASHGSWWTKSNRMTIGNKVQSMLKWSIS